VVLGNTKFFLQWLIDKIDHSLIEHYQVFTFTSDPSCLLRLALSKSPGDITLSGGLKIQKGESVGEFHLWNEHLPKLPPRGADLAWGLKTFHLLHRSFILLARYIERDHRFDEIRAFKGEWTFLPNLLKNYNFTLALRLGFDVVPKNYFPRRLNRFKEFWENVFAWALVWRHNPQGLRGRNLLRSHRCWLWMSRPTLTGIVNKVSSADK
jgi:hypothetical protein